VTAAETDDPQVLPLPKVPSNPKEHNANLDSHPLTPNPPHPLSKLVSHPPLYQPSQQTPHPLYLSTEKINKHLKTSQTTFKTNKLKKKLKNKNQITNNTTTQNQPKLTHKHTTKQHTQNTTKTHPP